MRYLMIAGGVLLLALGVLCTFLWTQSKNPLLGVMFMAIPGGVILIGLAFKNTGDAKEVKPSVSAIFGKKTEKTIPLVIWKHDSDGGIRDDYGQTEAEKHNIAVWTILGKEYHFKVNGDSVTPPVVDQPPEKFARLVGCKPRQKLNAADRDWLQRLAPYAPVAVIGIALLYMFIVFSAPKG